MLLQYQFWNSIGSHINLWSRPQRLYFRNFDAYWFPCLSSFQSWFICPLTLGAFDFVGIYVKRIFLNLGKITLTNFGIKWTNFEKLQVALCQSLFHIEIIKQYKDCIRGFSRFYTFIFLTRQSFWKWQTVTKFHRPENHE